MEEKPVFLTRAQREKLAVPRQEPVPPVQMHDADGKHPYNLNPESRISPATRERYLEQSRESKKRRVATNRFSFDWDHHAEDTSSHDPLYQTPSVAQPLFGRGLFAGIDPNQQQILRDKKKKDMLAVEGTAKDDDRRHWADKKLDEMTERDWRIFKEDFDISYKQMGGSGSSCRTFNVPRPMRSWDESLLSHHLLKAVERAKYNDPSPIQMAAIPLAMQQRDLIGVAETGSGKTAAFVLPMLHYISTRISDRIHRNVEGDEGGPYAVVLAPTRELAQQIERETVKFARDLGIKVVSIVGGQSIGEQGFRISQGCEVVIATPGRLLDCLERRYVVLNRCCYVVLDEADRMIDMGFEEQVLGVLDAMPLSKSKIENEVEEKRTDFRIMHMFSATMPPAVERQARKYLRNPIIVNVGTVGKAGDHISQNVIMMEENEKMNRLKILLDELMRDHKTAIVFVNTKRVVDDVAKTLEREGYSVSAVHGEMSQQRREMSLEGFRRKRCNVLVATDVLTRGIDIPDIGHVINYDMPKTIEIYTHRIGRTGRAGKTGVATTFLTMGDTQVFYDLRQMLEKSKSHVPAELGRHEASKRPSSRIR